MYSVDSTFPGVSPQVALQQIQQGAPTSGFLVVQPVAMQGSAATLIVGTKSAPLYPVMANARPNGTVTLIALVKPGIKVGQLELRNQMCDLMAHVGTQNASQAGGLSIGPITDASRTALPASEQPPKPDVLVPNVAFNLDAAKRALAPGNSTIQGVACGFYGKIRAYPETVELFPATPYMRQVFTRLAEDKDGQHSLQVSPIALDTRIEAKTGANVHGHFQFSHMKPGAYYVFARLIASAVVHYQRKVGSERGSFDDGFGGGSYSAGIYKNGQGIGSVGTTVYQLVEIPQDGATVSVTLHPKTPMHWLVGGWSGTHLLSKCD